eukprot:3420034-Rhodomonas_salina.2
MVVRGGGCEGGRARGYGRRETGSGMLPTCLRACYAVSGTEMAYAVAVLRDGCAVLRSCMVPLHTEISCCGGMWC